MKITILYDNTAWDKRLTPKWGFSCLIEAHHQTILFDTGGKGEILIGNMKKLSIDPSIIDAVFISHDHWDHTGGLADFLDISPVKVYIPYTCSAPKHAKEVVRIKDSLEIYKHIYSTGELANGEQSLVIQQDKGVVVIVGCSHPGVGAILDAASHIGNVTTLIGGLHGFQDFDLLKNVERICPTHCTQFIKAIRANYPDKYMEGGAGRVFTFD